MARLQPGQASGSCGISVLETQQCERSSECHSELMVHDITRFDVEVNSLWIHEGNT